MKSKVNFKLILLALLGFVLSAAITFAALTFFNPKEPTPVAEVEKPATVQSAKQIIEEIKKPETIPNLASLYEVPKEPSSGLAIINYTKKDSYRINYTAFYFAHYEFKNTDSDDNEASVIAAIKTYFTEKGLNKETSQNAGIYTIFDSDQTVCQLVTLKKMSSRPASLAISCVTKEEIAKTYDSIDKLLVLHEKATSTKLAPTTIQDVTFKEDDKTLTTLNAYGPEDKATSLLFAAVGEDWEYLGERALSVGTTEGNPIGIDRTLSSELKAQITDPKYGTFLKTYIK